MTLELAQPPPEGDASPDLARLEAAFEAASAALEQFVGHSPRVTPRPAPAPPAEPAALDALLEMFELDDFERDLLVLAAGAELSAQVADLCALAHKDQARPFMTFGLALAALPGGSHAAMSPKGALRRWRLVEFDASGAGGLMGARLSVPEAVVQFLLGEPVLDPRLSALLDQVTAPEVLTPTPYRLAQQIAAMTNGVAADPVLHLVGPANRSALDIAAAAAAMAGRRLYRLAEDQAPRDAEALGRLVGLWNRDRRLIGAGLVVILVADEAATDGVAEASRSRLASDLQGLVLFLGPGGAELPDRSLRPVLRLQVPPPDPYEVRAAWRHQLGDKPAVDSMAYQFALPLETLAAAAAAAQTPAGDEDEPTPEEVMARLWDLCRMQGRQKLTGLAQFLPARARIEDLVLAEPLTAMLQEIIAHHRHRPQVLLDWGFESGGPRGAGLSVLLAGPSGVGKTMAAEVLANALSLDLFRVDLSQVVNKYIGETEKNLRRLFDAADEGGAILLFDEADALFGKRSEVKDSHDRHANIEVGYLLQRIEAYRGIAILTTNMPDALDPAFLRRLNYILHLPFPDRSQRAEIWRRVFPADTPAEGLDYALLAQLTLTGGQIRNVALNAAMLAAEAVGPVDMGRVRAAALTEYGKQNRAPTTTELAGWP